MVLNGFSVLLLVPPPPEVLAEIKIKSEKKKKNHVTL